MSFLTILSLILIFGNQVLSQEVRYDHFQVYRVTPRNEESVQFLRELEELPFGYNFWTTVQGIDQHVDIMVPPHLQFQFEDSMKLLSINATQYIDNVQDLIDAEKVASRAAFDWTSYHNLNEINAWLQGLADSNPAVTLIVVGRSYEGRDILGVRVNLSGDEDKPKVFIEANIHAREWITNAVATYFLNELLTSNDPEIRTLAESRIWYIVPVFNVDGYVYTHERDRMWRKTRVPYSSCYGADPNRNWGYHWNEGGTSSSPCSETYRGPSAFSEPSTKSISEYISTITPLDAYIAFHSYSQLLLIPYGFTSEPLDNFYDLNTVGLKAADALSQRYGTEYTVGNIVSTIYVASGGSMDWVKGIFGTKITYTYELRDTGRYGFLLPPEQIIPTSEETIDSLLVIFKEFDKL